MYAITYLDVRSCFIFTRLIKIVHAIVIVTTSMDKHLHGQTERKCWFICVCFCHLTSIEAYTTSHFDVIS